jgi:hypothetical protein
VRVAEAVAKAVRTSRVEDLDDPQLTVLTRKLKTEINNVLPIPCVEEIIVSGLDARGWEIGQLSKALAQRSERNESADRGKDKKRLPHRQSPLISLSPDQPVAQSERETSDNRAVADWVLRNKGTIGLKEFPGRSFEFAEALPPAAFHIESVSLKDYVGNVSRAEAATPSAPRGRQFNRRLREQNRSAPSSEQGSSQIFHRVEFDDADIDRLASLTELKHLVFSSAALTDNVAARLTKLTNLTRLSLDKSSITDAGLHSLAGMTRLTDLDLDSTAVTDAGLTEIARLKSLSDLSLVPEAQRSGRELRGLPRLSLNHTRTTEAGIDRLQRSLPNCIVFASLPGYSPAPPSAGLLRSRLG